MFSYIKGIIEQKRDGIIVLENNGIGYEIYASNNTISSLPLQGEECKIHTYFQVKEDGVCLYGFSSEEEKDLFLKLISVNGIGPKNAINILSGYPITDLIVIIVSGDVKMLSRIKGLGGKTAERIILELKDKLSTLDIGHVNNEVVDENILDDAVTTLINLGMNKNDAYKLARTNYVEGITIEELISKTLRGM